jgi:hypothetical protein
LVLSVTLQLYSCVSLGDKWQQVDKSSLSAIDQFLDQNKDSSDKDVLARAMSQREMTVDQNSWSKVDRESVNALHAFRDQARTSAYKDAASDALAWLALNKESLADVSQFQKSARTEEYRSKAAALLTFEGQLQRLIGGREFYDLTKTDLLVPFFRAWNSSEENPRVTNAMCPLADEFAYQKSKPEFARVRAIKYVLFSTSYDADELDYDFAAQKYPLKYTVFNFLGPEGGVLYSGCRPRQQALHLTQTQSIAVPVADAEDLKKSIEVRYTDPRYRMLGIGGTKTGSLTIYTFGEIQDVKVVPERGGSSRFPLIKPVGGIAVWKREGQPTRILPVN